MARQRPFHADQADRELRKLLLDCCNECTVGGVNKNLNQTTSLQSTI